MTLARDIRCFVETHSYASGLQYTSFTPDGRRPDWAPPADSVGWRDEFTLEPTDTVFEISQRTQGDHNPTWFAVYRRSVDGRLGDRGNHAGIGAWVLDAGVANAEALMLSLNEFALRLAADPNPDSLRDQILRFQSEGFLSSYFVARKDLPVSWAGIPGANAALAPTTMRKIISDSPERCASSWSQLITRLTIGRNLKTESSRWLIAITPDDLAQDKANIAVLHDEENLLVTIIDALPEAYSEASSELAEARTLLETERSDRQRQVATLNQEFEMERRRFEELEGAPPTLATIAKHLNKLTRAQEKSLSLLNELQTVRRMPSAIPSQVQPPVPQVALTRSSTSSDDDWTPFILGAIVVLVGLAVVALGVWFFSQ